MKYLNNEFDLGADSGEDASTSVEALEAQLGAEADRDAERADRLVTKHQETRATQHDQRRPDELRGDVSSDGGLAHGRRA